MAYNPPPHNTPSRRPNNPPPPPSNDPTTLIGIRGKETRALAFRRSAAQFSLFSDLQLATYTAFQNSPKEYRLHFHFWRDTLCSREALLVQEEWERGEYWIGGSVEFFAHFMRRDGGGDRDRAGRGGNRIGVGVERGQLRRGGSQSRDMGYSASGGSSGFVPTHQAPTRNPYGTTSFASHTSTHHAAPHRFRNALNPRSITVYALCTPVPPGRYGKVKYFSAPSVFIPVLGKEPRNIYPQRYAEVWPGFYCSRASSSELGLDLDGFDKALAREREARGLLPGNEDLEVGELGGHVIIDVDEEEALWADGWEEDVEIKKEVVIKEEEIEEIEGMEEMLVDVEE